MWKKLKGLLFYACLSREQFEKVKSLAASENIFALKLASMVQILYFGISLMSSMSLSEMANKRLVYGFGTLIPFVILLLYFLLSKKHPEFLPWLIRGISLGLFLTGLLCTLVCTPDEMTLLLLTFFFCVPMIFIVPPIDLVFLVLITDIIYYAAAPFLKTPDVLVIDMIDLGIFSTLSIILGVSQMIGRYRRFWLESEAVELAEIRYQVAFIDQLTGAFNRNAYNTDTEKLNTADISDDFMFISLDINGLKNANDIFGHAAGDELIAGAADCMVKAFSDYGKIYRIGGDEFIVMINAGNSSGGEILQNFNRIIDEWSGYLVHKLSVSYGIILGSEAKGLSIHEIELLSDQRMYQSKSDYYKNEGIDRRRNNHLYAFKKAAN